MVKTESESDAGPVVLALASDRPRPASDGPLLVGLLVHLCTMAMHDNTPVLIAQKYTTLGNEIE
jgi:hypothetical protein